MKRILGLDASTTTIGLSVVDYDDTNKILVQAEFYKPNKKVPILESLAMVRAWIQEKVNQYKPDDVALEDIILFMKGKSNAKTITSLAVLNRTVGLAAFEALKKPITLYNVTKIRHAIKPTKKLPPKEDIPELVAQILKISFPYILDKKGKITVENFDVADSIACSLAFIVIEEKEEIKNKLKEKKAALKPAKVKPSKNKK